MIRMLFLLALFGVAHLDAQEDGVAATKEEPAATAGGETNTAAEKTEVFTPDSFKPTEKLSEDVPAAFPVDI